MANPNGLFAGVHMGRLTPEERRRVYLARQQASREMLARISATVAAPEPRSPRYRLARVIKTAMIAALLGGSWFAYTIEFHVPASIVEALLPRLQAAF
jgi:hypothetical protein